MPDVTFVDFPVQLANRARVHSEALLREFAFIVAEGRHDTALARRMLEIAATSDERYKSLNPEADALVDAAIERGDEYVDVAVWVPVEFKQAILDAVPVLLEVEQYCRNGQLLTLETPDEIAEFWRWYLGEFLRQIDGEAPQSWRDGGA
jgi:hypothetical protein